MPYNEATLPLLKQLLFATSSGFHVSCLHGSAVLVVNKGLVLWLEYRQGKVRLQSTSGKCLQWTKVVVKFVIRTYIW